MTYNERVRSIAEEMAWEVHKDHDPDSYGNLSKQLLPAARIAVKHMADIWADCWRMNNPYVADEEEGRHYASYQGLIPDSMEPVKQPEKEDWKL